jgi:hypothetical protein
LINYLDGPTAGTTSFVCQIGKALETCETLPLANFKKIECELPPQISTVIHYYISMENPQRYLVTLATYIIKSYAPVCFAIKMHLSSKDASKHLWTLINSTRYLSDELLAILDPVLIRNSYFAHPVNLMLSMITYPQNHIIELSARRI